MSGTIRGGDRFIVLNDVTTRGNCVSKLGKVVVDHGGIIAGMMVFARRDSGQFPLVDQLAVTYPFYYTTDLDMPQWEAPSCPLCKKGIPLVSWRDVPELQAESWTDAELEGSHRTIIM
jgi:orotate phosphoribosyltransferase